MLYCWEMQHSRLNGLNAGEKCLYSKECRGVYLVSLLVVRLLLGAPCWLNAVKSCIFRKSTAALIAFWYQWFWLNAIGYCVFRKSAAALSFVRLVLRAAFSRGYTVCIVFAEKIEGMSEIQARNSFLVKVVFSWYLLTRNWM